MSKLLRANDALKPRFGWHAKSYNPKMASIRLRMLMPINFLRGCGMEVEPYSSEVGPQGYDVLLFSKSFSDEAVQIAREARRLGKPVVYDICDNLFEARVRLDTPGRLGRVREMMTLATHITFSTEVLARQVQSVMPEIAEKSRVVPDVIEDLAGQRQIENSSGEQRQLAQLERFLSSHEGALHCVWFGKSQGKLSGFAHLGAAVRQLEVFARSHPVTLTIISNDRWRYWKAAFGWKLPTHYMPWSLGTFQQSLKLHDVAIVPVERNQYTVGKTINRPATAIAAGLGVIADSIDAYEELRPFIALDDWQEGLRRYAEKSPREEARLEAARQHLYRQYGTETVGQMWKTLLEQISGQWQDVAPAASRAAF